MGGYRLCGGGQLGGGFVIVLRLVFKRPTLRFLCGACCISKRPVETLR